MSKSDRIKGIIDETYGRMVKRGLSVHWAQERGFDNGTDNTDSVMLDRWGRDGIVHDTSGYRGIPGVGTHTHTPSPFPNTTHIDNTHTVNLPKDFNDIAQRQASSIIHQPCPSCHGTGRMSMSIVNGNTVMGHGGTMQLTGTGQDMGHGLGGGKG